MKKLHIFSTVLFFIIFNVFSVSASLGDSSIFYQRCVGRCATANCTKSGVDYKNSLKLNQQFINRLLLWSCVDECKYDCMWATVNSFNENRWNVPKFHGKWPFIRVFGIQELGSVIGSILNLVSHLYMFNLIQTSFKKENTPLLWLWKGFFLVCTNAWIWSIVFHTRDTPFTEFMDYACALSMIMMLLYTCGIRLLYGKPNVFSILFTGVCLLYYIDHVSYLYYSSVDYEYNMLANIIPGSLAVILWTLWAVYKMRKGYKYAWRILAFNILTAFFMVLELFDFPPFMYIWDAHALWHLSTASLPLLFYRFVYDDLVHLRQFWPDFENKSSTKIC